MNNNLKKRIVETINADSSPEAYKFLLERMLAPKHNDADHAQVLDEYGRCTECDWLSLDSKCACGINPRHHIQALYDGFISLDQNGAKMVLAAIQFANLPPDKPFENKIRRRRGPSRYIN